MRVRKTTFLREQLYLWLFLISTAGFGQAVSSITPSVVTQRSSIAVTGTGFTTSSTVRFYTTSVNDSGSTVYVSATSVTYVSATQLTVIVPAVLAANTASTPLTFRIFNGALFSAPFTYTYVAPHSYGASSGITEVVTNWNAGNNQGYWKSSSASGNANQQPDGAHSVMGFKYGGVVYSTGNETTITNVLNAAGYGAGTFVTGNFRALPIKNIQGSVPNGGPNLIVLGSLVDGSATTQVPAAPNVSGLSVRDVLIDGTRGLGLGTGVTNLPSTSVLSFSASNIIAGGIDDGVPDIIVSQIAEPTNDSFSVYSFTDNAGNIVGYPIQVAFSSVSVIGKYKSDFFTLPVGQPINTAQVNGSLTIGANTRDIRLVAYKLTEFGITSGTGGNSGQATIFKVMPSGTSDPAFMAYNRNTFLIPAPEITGQPTSQAICPGGQATFTVSVASTSSGTETPAYQWEKNGVALINGNGVSGATTATLSISPVTAANAGVYRCLVTNATGAALSNNAYLNTVITAGNDVATCVNSAASVTVSALGNTPSYQWYSNTTANNATGTLIAGQTGSSYSPPVTTAGTYYYYAKSKPSGLSCAEAEVTSGIIEFTVVSLAAGGVVTPADQSVCPNGYAAVTVSEYTGSAIQWQSSATNVAANFTDIPTSQTTTATTPTLYIADSGTTTKYYRAKITGGCGNTTVYSPVAVVTVNDTYTWTGNVSTDWSVPGNWTCNAIPSITTEVIIPAAPVNQPSVQTITALAKNLTVEAGASVTVQTAGTLRVADFVNVATGATLTVNNNGALLQDNDVANTGLITVKRNSNALYKLDYTLWSSPVAGQNLGNFSTATLPNRFYEYRYGFDTTQPGGGAWKEQYWATPSTDNFVPGRGTLIRMPDAITGNGSSTYAAGSSTHTFPGSFTGVPNNGNIQPALSLSTANDNQGSHFYLVGNPYPSPISVYDFLTDPYNAARLETGCGIYFWRKKNNNPVSSYATLTLSGYTSNSGTPGYGGENNAPFYPANTAENPNNNQSWIISPGQAFLVKLKSGITENVMFKNSMRRAAPAAGATPSGQPFFRTMQNSIPSRYWLNLADAEGLFSQALVAYSEEGTTGLDYGYDGLELAQGSIRLYSKEQDNNFTIQARPQFEVSDVVTMGFTVANAGQYTISLPQRDGLFEEGQNIYLKDNQLGVTHNLIESAYAFTTDAGTIASRFEVVYVNTILDANNPELALNDVMVYKQNAGNIINISSGALDMTGVKIYDMSGRQLYSKEVTGTQAAVNLNIQQQVIIVEVTTTAGKVTKKVIF